MEIITIADLLNAFSKHENERLKKKQITHRPTIGKMYEGLTAKILNATVFDGLNLVVAKGSFIEGSDTEYDIILAEGEGAPVDYVEDSYIFKPQQVLVVIQVKKTLYSKDLGDSYENLKGIFPLYTGGNAKDYMIRIASDAIRSTLGKQPSSYRNGLLNKYEEYVYHTLVTEAQLPLRIVLGYNGFKSEESFRNSIVEYFGTKKSTLENKIEGYGPNNLPSLIICDEYSCVKTTGCPFSAPLNPNLDGWWNIYGTSHYNPMYFFLEMIWSLLSYRYHLDPEIFGDDLKTPLLSPFLDCRVCTDTQGEAIGWDYDYYLRSEEQLSENNDIQYWQPVEIDSAQFAILSELGQKGLIDVSKDADIKSFVIKSGYDSLQAFIDKLVATKLVSYEGTCLKILTHQCQMVTVGGKWYAAENNTGRLTRWVSAHMDELMGKEAKEGGY